MNTPLAPPVEMMYFFPAARNALMLLATPAGVTPAQVSLPHSPLAKAQVSAETPLVMTWVMGSIEPVTPDRMVLVFQSMLIVMSLYGLMRRPAASEHQSRSGQCYI